ncbi:GM23438 [Drosophila sechellia]|uniref:GM23438 n=1 Tax=Drosophila sechellia TaxID=7238 RepID=B4IP19_DROSE|nr:GM23438 [Drosophila sechellia]
MEAQKYLYPILMFLCCCGIPLEVRAIRMRMPVLPEALNCRNENISFNLNLTRLSGYWYEAARVPNVQVLQCLNVSVPAEVEKDSLSLDLNFISTVNNGWQFTEESVEFPWNNYTQGGIFKLDYDTVTVTYKLMITDYENIAFVCGFGSISPVPLFKLFTRQREVSQDTIDTAKSLAESYGMGNQIAWEMQSPDECNGFRWSSSYGYSNDHHCSALGL